MNYHLILRAEVIKNSQSDDWETAKLEWNVVPHVNYNEEGTHCTCTHSIKWEYYIENVNNRKQLKIGSHCIKQFDRPDMLQAVTRLRKWSKCTGRCRKDHPIKDLENGRCKICRGDDPERRVCLGCQKYPDCDAEVTGHRWLVRCKRCYAVFKSTTTSASKDIRDYFTKQNKA